MSKSIDIWVDKNSTSTFIFSIVDQIEERALKGCRVRITDVKESRSDVQNRLFHVFVSQYAKEFGYEKEYVAGMWKWDYLRPIKLASKIEHKAGRREEALVEGAAVSLGLDFEFQKYTPRELQIEAAYEVIRSNKLSVPVFTEWLETIMRNSAEQGLVLRSNKDDIAKALAQDDYKSKHGD